MDDLLRKLWFDSSEERAAAFARPDVLYAEARKYMPQIKQKDVNRFLRQQLENTSFKQVKRSGRDRFTLVNYPGTLIAIDALYLKKFGHAMNIRFLLVFVDVFSGYTLVAGLKSLKNSVDQFAKLLNTYQKRFKVKNIITDKGGENVAIKKYAEKQGIDVFYAPDISPHKASRAERQHYFIRRRMAAILKHNRKLLPLTAAKRSVAIYNNTVNTATGYKPNDVSPENVGAIIRKRMDDQFQHLSKLSLAPQFSIGDVVKLRITRKNRTFLKSNDPTFYDDSYTIVDIKPTSPRFSYFIRKEGGNKRAQSVPESYLQLVTQNVADQSKH